MLGVKVCACACVCTNESQERELFSTNGAGQIHLIVISHNNSGPKYHSKLLK
jgi:hypothetical protein